MTFILHSQYITAIMNSISNNMQKAAFSINRLVVLIEKTAFYFYGFSAIIAAIPPRFAPITR